jgi:hypothetical protein
MLIVICGSVPALAPLWERLIGRRRRRGYANANTPPYVVSSDCYASASGRGAELKTHSKGHSYTRTMVVTTTESVEGGGTVLYPDDDATGRPGNGIMGTGGKLQAGRDGDDVELARLTKMHRQGAAYLPELSHGGFQ